MSGPSTTGALDSSAVTLTVGTEPKTKFQKLKDNVKNAFTPKSGDDQTLIDKTVNITGSTLALAPQLAVGTAVATAANVYNSVTKDAIRQWNKARAEPEVGSLGEKWQNFVDGATYRVASAVAAPVSLPVSGVVAIITRARDVARKARKDVNAGRVISFLDELESSLNELQVLVNSRIIDVTSSSGAYDSTSARILTVKEYIDNLKGKLAVLAKDIGEGKKAYSELLSQITELNENKEKVKKTYEEAINTFNTTSTKELTPPIASIIEFHNEMKEPTKPITDVLTSARNAYNHMMPIISKIFDAYTHVEELKKILTPPQLVDFENLHQQAVNVQTEWKNAFDLYTPKVAAVARTGTTALPPPSMHVFKTIKDSAAIPDRISEETPSAARIDYNEIIFKEIAQQITVAAAVNGGKIPIGEFAYNKTIGDLLNHFDTVEQVARDSYHLKEDKDIQRFVGFFEYMMYVLMDFYTWVVTTKAVVDKNVDRALFDKYVSELKDKSKYFINPSVAAPDASTAFTTKAIKDYYEKTAKRVTKEGLRMIEGLVPIDRIEHFKELDDLEGDLKDEMLDIQNEMEIEDREYERMMRDQRTIAEKYTELMTLLPDKDSREAAQKFINDELAARGIKYKFSAAGGAPKAEKLLPMIRDMLGTIPPSADEAHVRENMKGTLLALIQGTGLEKKVADLAAKSGDDVSSIILDGVKTGILASIAASTSSKAIASMVAPDNTPYQDAVAKAAVLSAIATMLKEKEYKESAKKLEAAATHIMEKQESNDPLLYQVALSAILAALKSATKNTDDLAATLQRQIDVIDDKIAKMQDSVKPDNLLATVNAEIAGLKKPENLPITKEQLLLMTTQALLSIGALTKKDVVAATGSPDADAVGKMVRDALSGLDKATESVLNKKITEIVDNAVKDVGVEGAANALKAAAKEKAEAASELANVKAQYNEQIAALREQLESASKNAAESKHNYEQLQAQVQEIATRDAKVPADLQQDIDRARQQVEQAVAAQEAIQASISEVNAAAKRAEASATSATAAVGRAEAAAQSIQKFSNEQEKLIKTLIKLMVDRAKEYNGEFDATPYAGAMEGGDGAAADATKPQDTTAQAKQIRKDLDEVKKTLRGITDAFGGLKSKYERFKKTLPSEDERDNLKNGKYGDSKRVLGVYSYLNEEGRKFVDELKNTIAEKKKALVTAQETVQKVYDTEPTNAIYIKDAGTLKTVIEGDYVSGEAGVLSIMDGIAGGIQTEYDENFSVLKAAAEGIKQEKEYAIREKQQVVAPMYGVPAASSSASAAEAEKVRAAQANTKKSKDTAAALMIDIQKYLDKVIENIDDVQKKLDTETAKDEKEQDKTLISSLKTKLEGLNKANTTIESKKTAAGTKIKAIEDALDGFDATGKDPIGADVASRYASSASQKVDEIKELVKDVEVVLKDATNVKIDKKSASTDDILKKFDDISEKVGKTLLVNLVQKLDGVYMRKLNPAFNAATNSEPTMFAMLWDNYIRKKVESGPMLAAKELTEQMEANNLIPSKVLQISMIDKSIFIFVTLVIRMISLSITSYIITKGKLRTLPWALGAFLFIYALIYVAFVMFINLDMYRLRIIFNFLNLHGNTPNIFLHLLLMWLFSFVIFMIMWNINFPLRGVKTEAISDEEKADLIYRLEVLTMIVWLFLVLMIVIAR